MIDDKTRHLPFDTCQNLKTTNIILFGTCGVTFNETIRADFEQIDPKSINQLR